MTAARASASSDRRVLLVGMPHSIHIARLCAMLADDGWAVHLFPSEDAPPHPELRDVVVFDPAGRSRGSSNVEIRRVFPSSELAARPGVRALALARVVDRLKPVLVHAHEIQHGGYLAAAARSRARAFPPLVMSAWGSDLSLRARLSEERPRIVDLLQRCDVFMAECERDLRHARRLGFAGETVLPQPITGGFDLQRLRSLRAPGPTSARRTIAVKGYQGWAGRAQVALRALEIASPFLAGYRLGMYLAHRDEAELVRRLSDAAGIEVETFALGVPVPHERILALHGRARVSIGLGIADGVSTSFLEAIAMGSVPIQSATACANEWIRDGVSGFIVPPEDPDAVAAALRRALEDDAFVDAAAGINDATVAARASVQHIRARTSALYERIAAGRIVRAPREPQARDAVPSDAGSALDGRPVRAGR